MVYRTYKPRRSFDLFGNVSLSLTIQLIILNVIFFVVSIFLLSFYGENFFYENIALTPSLILSGKSLWTFVTSMFAHGGFFHLFANMFSLFFIGSFLEKIIGKKRFLWVYLISGLVGGIFFVLSGLIFNSNIPGIGASGAIFGILGVLAVLIPYSRIYLFVGPLIVLIFMAIFPEFAFIGNFIILLMIFSMMSFNPSMRRLAVPLELRMWVLPIIAIVPLVAIGFFIDLPIGNSAHIGGLVVGLAYGFFLRKKYKRKTAMISRHFS